MYDWLSTFLGLPAQGANSNIVQILGAFFLGLSLLAIFLIIVIFNRIFNGGRRG